MAGLANPVLRPPQEGLETRVGAQGIKDRITPQENRAARMFLIGFLQPLQRFFFFPQSGVKARNLLLGPLLCNDFGRHPLSRYALAGFGPVWSAKIPSAFESRQLRERAREGFPFA